MSVELHERLNQILPRITTDEFLSGAGMGNEIAFHTRTARGRTGRRRFLMSTSRKPEAGTEGHGHRQSARPRAGLPAWSEPPGSLAPDAAGEGQPGAMKALRAAPRSTRTSSPRFSRLPPSQGSVTLFWSPGGSVWPLLRSHSLTISIQSWRPLVMFYPGRYDGQSLRLFGKLKNNKCYRAFKLVPCRGGDDVDQKPLHS